jgi:outer membrane receptor protein involved in Fe transport
MRANHTVSSLALCGVSTIVLTAFAGAVAAQTAGGSSGTASSGPASSEIQLAQAKPQSGSPAAATKRPVMEEIIVTAQRREEALQAVPIAVSAFSAKALELKKIEGGASLQQSIPNSSYSRGNFGGYNFQIRGIGTKLVATGADTATSVHVNNSPVTANNLQDVDFYDMERVEVLRGPQGTLYGRNATGGVINLITAKPTDKWEGMVQGEFAEFGTVKVKGAINAPLVDDKLDLRVAGAYVKRDGYGTNLTSGTAIDGRDLYATRATLSFTPSSNFHSYLMYERFDEDDNKSRIGKQLCAKDTPPTSVGGIAVIPGSLSQGFLSQGCKPAALDSASSLGAVDSRATLGGLLGNLTGLLTGDSNAGKIQDGNLRTIEASADPIYRSKSDYVQFSANWDISDKFTLSSLTAYNKTTGLSVQDYNRITGTATFNATPFSPGGVFTDPQVGATNQLRTYDKGDGRSTETVEELRLQSNLSGPFNFNVGGIYIDLHSLTNYYVLGNTLTAYSLVSNGGLPCALNSPTCVYIDPKPAIAVDGVGHNYYDNRTDYRLNSKAVFGEGYFQASDDLKITAGIRYTQDTKTAITFNVPLLAPGSGLTPNPKQTAHFNEATGKFGVDWKPKTSFTDDSLLYANYSRGYKGGGFNPPGSVGVASVGPTYAPEFVDAFEVGTKNVLHGGDLVLNGTGFYYTYTGYQVSQIINRTSVNVNIDAKVKGLEFESLWSPISPLTFNANAGYLDTEITNGAYIDTFNRTQGDPSLTLVKNSNASNCVANTAAVAAVLRLVNLGALGPTTLLGICSGALAALGAVPSEGKLVNLKGNQLPNAPHWNLSLGAQYTATLADDWSAIVRLDYYSQGEAFTRIFNASADRLSSWDNTNLSVRFANQRLGLTVEGYMTNIFDNTPITDAYLTDDSSGLFRNIFTLDPRIIGMKITKRF